MNVYVAVFWLRSDETIVFHFASLSREAAVSAAQGYVVREALPDAATEKSLLDRIAHWDGQNMSELNLPAGRLILFPMELHDRP